AFENRTATLTRDLTLALAEAGGSRRYRESWAIGAALGLFGSLAGGGALIGLAAALRRRALPAEIIPLHPANGVARPPAAGPGIRNRLRPKRVVRVPGEDCPQDRLRRGVDIDAQVDDADDDDAVGQDRRDQDQPVQPVMEVHQP